MRKRAAVIGGGIGGMAAAGFLARAGLDVTLFEAQPALGGKAQRLHLEGLRLDAGPTLLTMPEVVRDTFTALGAADLLPRLLELPRQCDYRFADGRCFTAWRDLERTVAEAAAVDAADGRGLRAFYAEAEAVWRAAGAPYLEEPFDGMAGFVLRVARRGPGAVLRGVALGTLAGLARKHLRSPALRQFVGRFATYVGASPGQVSAAFALIPHLERAEGVWHAEGGMAAVVDGLAAALQRLGVHVATGTPTRWRPLGSRFLVGPTGGELETDVVVVNGDPVGERTARPLALSGYVLLLGVPRRLALPHHHVWFARDYDREFAQLIAGDPPDDPTVYACHPVASDPSMAAEGRSGLFVMVNAPTLPPGTRPDRWPHADRMRARCLERLETEVPGIAREAVVLGERTPADFAREGAPRGSLYGYLPAGRFGAFRRPRMRGTPPGLFFAGGGTHPGGGVPMVMLSGRFAAGMALRHLGET